MEGEKGEGRVLLTGGMAKAKRNYISYSSRYWASTFAWSHSCPRKQPPRKMHRSVRVVRQTMLGRFDQ